MKKPGRDASQYGILLNKDFDKNFDLVKRYNLAFGKIYRFDQKNFREIIAEVNDKIDNQLSPAELNGITLITAALQIILFKYWNAQSTDLDGALAKNLINSFGSYHLDRLKNSYQSNFSLVDEMFSSHEIYPELITTWLTNINRAFKRYKPFFDDNLLSKEIPYFEIMDNMETFFGNDSKLDKSGKNIILKNFQYYY